MVDQGEITRRGFLGTALAGMVLPGALMEAKGQDSPKPVAFRNPYVYRFQIGEIEAFSISDGHMPLREGLGLMWPQESRPEMLAEMERLSEQTDRIPLYVNILVIRSGKEIAVFDAGFGRGNNPNIGWLEAGLATAGIAPEMVTASFLSHAHSDHLAGFVTAGKPTFPNAALHLLPEELDFWRTTTPDFSKSKRDAKQIPGMIREVRANFDVLQPQLQPVKGGAELFGGKVRVEAAPGHTAGHACFRIRSGKEELLHLMDLSHHHMLMFRNPDWTIAFDHDPVQSVVTRKKFWKEAAARRTRCMGFHLPWPGLGRIVPDGSGYLWHAERWSWGS